MRHPSANLLAEQFPQLVGSCKNGALHNPPRFRQSVISARRTSASPSSLLSSPPSSSSSPSSSFCVLLHSSLLLLHRCLVGSAFLFGYAFACEHMQMMCDVICLYIKLMRPNTNTNSIGRPPLRTPERTLTCSKSSDHDFFGLLLVSDLFRA